jgi:hypothetical protein
VDHGDIKVINILPLLVSRLINVCFDEFKGAALVQLHDCLFGIVAEATPGAGEEGQSGLTEEGACWEHIVSMSMSTLAVGKL